MNDKLIEYSKQTIHAKEEMEKLYRKQGKLIKRIEKSKNLILKISNEVEKKELKILKYKEELKLIPQKISKLEIVIPERKRKREAIITELSEKEKMSADLSKEIDRLQEILKERVTQDFTNIIYNVTEKNSYSAFLERGTKTTPIMDKLLDEKTNFLLLTIDHYSYVHIDNRGMIGIKYVVIDQFVQNLICNDFDATITDIKCNDTMLPRAMHDDAERILKATYITQIHEGVVFPFKVPYSFKAQNSTHQTGFGNYYEWGELVYEGTKYGDTSRYYVIGFIVNRIF